MDDHHAPDARDPGAAAPESGIDALLFAGAVDDVPGAAPTSRPAVWLKVAPVVVGAALGFGILAYAAGAWRGDEPAGAGAETAQTPGAVTEAGSAAVTAPASGAPDYASDPVYGIAPLQTQAPETTTAPPPPGTTLVDAAGAGGGGTASGSSSSGSQTTSTSSPTESSPPPAEAPPVVAEPDPSPTSDLPPGLVDNPGKATPPGHS